MKRRWFIALARFYVRRKLRKAFGFVRIRGLLPAREVLAQRSCLLFANHVSYWDPLLLVFLEEILEADGYCLMDAGQLSKFSFFRALGAVPLDRSSAAKSLSDLRKSLDVLQEKQTFLAIFPQGKQVPAHLPLEFQRGILWLVRHSALPLLPVAIRYDFLQGEKPVIHLSIGPVLESDGAKSLLEYERAIERELQAIDQEILGSSPSPGCFEQVLDGGGDLVPSGGARALRLLGGRS